MRRLISSNSPYEEKIGYSRAVVQGDWCFVSGTTGPDPDTSEFPISVSKQAENALKIIEVALQSGGFDMRDIVRVTYYLKDTADVSDIMPVLSSVFGDIRPAATMLRADLIDPKMKIEIEVTAFRG